ncbi:MAG: glycosyltransferase family 9 protein [Planctomycetota bacterium]|jgi:lipopolysaccharide heptosyltransferase II
MIESSDKIDSQSIGRLRRRPLGRYRYVRLRWRVTFAVIDLVGTVLFAAARLVWRSVTGRRTPAPEKRHDPKVILLVQLDHLGDAIISTTMFPALRKQYPEASIEVLAGAWNREVFEALPEVSRVHVSRANRFARGGLHRFAWIPATLWWGLILRRRKVDLGIDVRGEFPAAVILWLCGARRRLGWDCGGGGFLLTDSPRFVADRPEVESRMALLAELGIRPPEAVHRRPSLRPTVAARRQIARCLTELTTRQPATGPLVVLHVGAGTAAKAWPVEHWRELLGRIIVGHGVRVVLVGGRQDRIIAEEILDGRVWPGVADWTGRLGVVELAALLEQADVLVGVDSGPAHLAAAVGTPVVVMFSGTNSPLQWQPCGEQVTVIRHEVGCQPCHRERCPRAGHPCMKLLRPRWVAAEVSGLLHNRPCRHLGRLTAAVAADEPSYRRKGVRP